MTNFEYIRTCKKEELAKLLCMDLVNSGDYEECSTCVANKYCGLDHIGFTDWLDKERGEDE